MNSGHSASGADAAVPPALPLGFFTPFYDSETQVPWLFFSSLHIFLSGCLRSFEPAFYPRPYAHYNVRSRLLNLNLHATLTGPLSLTLGSRLFHEP
jgi:hypothetical protein